MTPEEERQKVEGVRQPWEQREDESGAAFEAFKTFLDLGIARTVSAAYRQKTGKASAKMASGQWIKWAKRYEWFARAQEFDRYVATIEAREEESAFAASRRLWVSRRSDVQNSAWTLAEALEKKAREILDLPTVQRIETRTEDEGGKKVTVTVINNPVRASYSEAIRAAEVADKLRRLAVGMATERVVTKSPAAELAETLADARHAFREARELYGETEAVEVTARNIAAAYALEVNQLLEGYDEGQPLASQASN